MDKIEFKNVLPEVFKHEKELCSDVWCCPDVTFEKGKTYLVQASSGTGKSTMCSYMIGYRHDYSGEVLFDGIDTKRYSHSKWTEIRQQRISHLFQELRLFPELTAMENVEIKNRLTRHLSKDRILELFDKLGISNKVDSKLGIMSFGQQQRVSMIRAVAQPFDFILVDEPISHLDDENSRIMGEIMMDEARRQGAGVIVTSIGKHMALDYDKILHL